jgi:hypothetical protein
VARVPASHSQAPRLEIVLHLMLRILSVTPSEKVPMFQLLTDMAPAETSPANPNQRIPL